MSLLFEGQIGFFDEWALAPDEPDLVATREDCRVSGVYVMALADAFLDAAPGALAEVPAPDVEAPSAADGERWTADRLASLKQCRDAHGTKAAAEKFGISVQRVRQLLPGKKPTPTGYSAFSHRIR